MQHVRHRPELGVDLLFIVAVVHMQYTLDGDGPTSDTQLEGGVAASRNLRSPRLNRALVVLQKLDGGEHQARSVVDRDVPKRPSR